VDAAHRATAGDIVWPTPQRIPVGSMANYGFSDTILLPVPLTITSRFQPTPGGDLEVRLSASWLVCRQECIPQEGNFVLRVPAKGSTASHGGDFEATRAASPTDLPGKSQAKLEGNGFAVTVSGLPASWQWTRAAALSRNSQHRRAGDIAPNG
jgi:DsbC/DsbD-like thiol-disulfide interchange protein